MTPLHAFGNLVRNLLLEVPLPAARILFLAIPIVLLLWVLQLSRQQTTPAQETGKWGENLKVGASIALVIQILIYSWL